LRFLFLGGIQVTPEQFEKELVQLEQDLIATCSEYFGRMGKVFSYEELVHCTSIDIQMFVREIFYYGANVVPELPSTDSELTTASSASMPIEIGIHS